MALVDTSDGHTVDTNWFEVVSSEVRSWWEVIQREQPRTPDPDPMMERWRWQVLQGTPAPNGIIADRQNVTISTQTLLLLGVVVIAILVLNK